MRSFSDLVDAGLDVITQKPQQHVGAEPARGDTGWWLVGGVVATALIAGAVTFSDENDLLEKCKAHNEWKARNRGWRAQYRAPKKHAALAAQAERLRLLLEMREERREQERRLTTPAMLREAVQAHRALERVCPGWEQRQMEREAGGPYAGLCVHKPAND